VKKYLLIFIILLSISNVNYGATSYYFFIQFTDKQNTPYSLSNPSEYLSEKAIARRAAFGIECDTTDLPVNPQYIAQISGLGLNVHSRSKWLNGITVTTTDSNVLSQVRLLTFVKKVQYTGLMSTAAGIKARSKSGSTQNINYGIAATQANQINISALHSDGFTGKGILIGVLDAGFYNANINRGLDSLRLQGRLLGTKDIILPGNNVYAEDTHGANVLSIMTGNIPGTYVGMAPQASYLLIRTEYVPSEYLYETDFWTAGIEFADSVGVDIINSSLGYTEFDDARMNYTYADMNGKVSRASIAAGMAANKGIIVCNSAGNEGADTWHYIGAPADAENIFTVGGVTSTGAASSFTSYGPSSDNRIKPEVSAMATSTAYINYSGNASTGNGTSYSSPIIAGALACLLQKYKSTSTHLSMTTFRSAVLTSGSTYTNPTQANGYGIPDFEKATVYLNTAQDRNTQFEENLWQLTQSGKLVTISNINNSINETIHYKITDLSGKQIISGQFASNSETIDCSFVVPGVYFAILQNSTGTTALKFVLRP